MAESSSPDLELQRDRLDLLTSHFVELHSAATVFMVQLAAFSIALQDYHRQTTAPAWT
jgi:hypothetical protein